MLNRSGCAGRTHRFHQPLQLALAQRERKIVGGAGFEGIDPFGGFGEAREDDERQAGEHASHASQQRQVVGRFASNKDDVGTAEIVRRKVGRLAFHVVQALCQRITELLSGGWFDADE